LAEPGAPLGVGQIHDSNSYLLTAAVREVGAIAYRVAAVPDDPGRLLGAIEDQLGRADVIVTSGGVSVGAHDVVKEALSRSGTVQFETVAMQPGKPQGHGTIGPERTPIITLPGNPVSAFVSFEVFVRPLLRRLSGASELHRPMVSAVLTDALRSPGGRRQFARATLAVADGRYVVSPVGGPGSHLLGALARANAFIVVPEEVTAVPAGDAVTVMVLENPPS
jgi:molybdopterin molybdotransferase